MTLRELLWMAEARSKAEWGRTAALLALIANVNRDPKKGKAFTPSDFNPHERKTTDVPATPITDFSILKAVFVDRHLGGSS